MPISVPDLPEPTSNGPEVLEAYNLILALDYGQFWIATGPIDELDPMDPLTRAIEGDGIAQEGPLTTVLSPHQNNFEMPLRVEVWSTQPPNDLGDWPEAFELHLDIDEDGLYIDSPTASGHRVPVSPGSYRALITGRNFVAHGWPGSTTPGDDWRIQLWPAEDAVSPRRLSGWRA
jgi:hypothetical protein